MHIIYADGIGARGLGAGFKESVLIQTVERITRRKPSYTNTRLTWPSYRVIGGSPLSWTEASLIGVSGISEIMDIHFERSFILLGYSGGCRVIHEWMYRNPHRLDRVAAVGLVADPYRPRIKYQGDWPTQGGWGLYGEEYGPLTNRTLWTTAPGDVVSDAPPDSPLRGLAAASDMLPGQLLWDLSDHLPKSDFRLARRLGLLTPNPVGWFTDRKEPLNKVREDIRKYVEGRHTIAYTTPMVNGLSLAETLGEDINKHLHG